MARFTSNIGTQVGDTANDTWVAAGGVVSGTTPTYNGDPLFTGGYNLIDNICHFHIDWGMDNVTNFGSGQYYVELPFASKNNYLLSDGCLHDTSASHQYSILGHVVAGSNILSLFSVGNNGRQVSFTGAVPVTLSTADNIHIAGVYEIEV